MKCIFLDSNGNCHAEEHTAEHSWKVDEERKKLYCTLSTSPFFLKCPRFTSKMSVLTKERL